MVETQNMAIMEKFDCKVKPWMFVRVKEKQSPTICVIKFFRSLKIEPVRAHHSLVELTFAFPILQILMGTI